MATAKIVYSGDLRTTCTHLSSQSSFNTDAPVDNNGKGEAFSPTDLIGTALVACMQTIVGIYCESNAIPFSHCNGEVTKIMASSPRRISELHIYLDFSQNNWSTEIHDRIKRAAEACPVAKSIHPEIKCVFNYQF